MNTPDLKQSANGWPRNNGMTVPDGYFEDFARRMMDRIPAEPATPAVTHRRSKWQIIRPYVYMAAMFAGVYLMMNIFSFTSNLRNADTQSSTPLLAELVNTGTASYLDDYLTSVSDLDLYNDLYESGFEIPESL